MHNKVQLVARKMVLKSYRWWCAGVILSYVFFWPIVVIIAITKAGEAFKNTLLDWLEGDFALSIILSKSYFDRQRRIDRWKGKKFLNDPKMRA